MIARLNCVLNAIGQAGLRTDVESRYHSNELECLALVWSLEGLRAYLWGKRFKVFTDNSALRWLWEKKAVTGKFARWVVHLQEFDFETLAVT